MPRRRRESADGSQTSSQRLPSKAGNGADNGFEAQLFLAADKLRKNVEPSHYKTVAS